jgi:hypothetical protein
MNLIIEHCKNCGTADVRVDKAGYSTGEIYEFDLCLSCEDVAGQMLTADESFMTLERLVRFNDAEVYGGGYTDEILDDDVYIWTPNDAEVDCE